MNLEYFIISAALVFVMAVVFTSVYGILMDNAQEIEQQYGNYSVVETVEDADVEEPAGDVTSEEAPEEPVGRPDCVEVDSDGRPVVNYNC